MKILIIDDNPADRALIMACLPEHEPVSILQTDSVEEGLELIARQNPDCVFIDFLVGHDDGLEAIARLTQYGNAPKPVVLVTAYASADLQKDAMALGCCAFISKTDLNRITIAEALQRAHAHAHSVTVH